jgi:hypothetical protein
LRRNRPFIRLTFGPPLVAGVDQIVMHPARLPEVGHIDGTLSRRR